MFHRHWAERSVARVDHSAGCIEGIGRQRVEPSFLPDIVDRMEVVADAASIAAAHEVSARLGRRCGGSTGTNVWACARIAAEMAARGETGSIVSILCDDGARYADTIFDPEWLAARDLDVAAPRQAISDFFETGRFAG